MPGDPSVSVATCVELCRGAPLLEEIYHSGEELSDAAARELGQLCPLLKAVDFTCETYSAGETWAKHFPNLSCMSLRARQMNYCPTLLDAIAALARVTKATELDIEGCDVTLDLIEVLVGTPFGDRLESFGDTPNGEETWLEPDAVLASVM